MCLSALLQLRLHSRLNNCPGFNGLGKDNPGRQLTARRYEKHLNAVIWSPYIKGLTVIIFLRFFQKWPWAWASRTPSSSVWCWVSSASFSSLPSSYIAVVNDAAEWGMLAQGSHLLVGVEVVVTRETVTMVTGQPCVWCVPRCPHVRPCHRYHRYHRCHRYRPCHQSAGEGEEVGLRTTRQRIGGIFDEIFGKWQHPVRTVTKTLAKFSSREVARQHSVYPVTKISSKWRHFHFSKYTGWSSQLGCDPVRNGHPI